jgi:hypothetical protein
MIHDTTRVNSDLKTPERKLGFSFDRCRSRVHVVKLALRENLETSSRSLLIIVSVATTGWKSENSSEPNALASGGVLISFDIGPSRGHGGRFLITAVSICITRG